MIHSLTTPSFYEHKEIQVLDAESYLEGFVCEVLYTQFVLLRVHNKIWKTLEGKGFSLWH